MKGLNSNSLRRQANVDLTAMVGVFILFLIGNTDRLSLIQKIITTYRSASIEEIFYKYVVRTRDIHYRNNF